MITVKVHGLDQLKSELAGKARQIRFATAKALTITGHAVRSEVINELHARLDRPTSYTTKQAIQVLPATKETLSTRVGLGVKYDAPSKGTPYAKAIGHLFTGGERSFKKMEGAFLRLGVLPPGWIMVPGKACPLDGYGNISRGFIVQLISYFNAFAEQGYKANMSDKKRGKIEKRGLSEGGYKTINGVAYFISRGKGNWFGGRSWKNGRTQSLPPGIWAKSGVHGVSVKPIIMFVRMGNWTQRIDLDRIARAVVSKSWQSNFISSLENALRSSR